mmetsp:Transcript_6207/g.18797  ORF Transcript_6207/g.18797 Transcript_6207/m.18797 type:complete len:223 (+) Transcript_6207:2865-3533(+)
MSVTAGYEQEAERGSSCLLESRICDSTPFVAHTHTHTYMFLRALPLFGPQVLLPFPLPLGRGLPLLPPLLHPPCPRLLCVPLADCDLKPRELEPLDHSLVALPEHLRVRQLNGLEAEALGDRVPQRYVAPLLPVLPIDAHGVPLGIQPGLRQPQLLGRFGRPDARALLRVGPAGKRGGHRGGGPARSKASEPSRPERKDSLDKRLRRSPHRDGLCLAWDRPS